ncbi:MAG: hypothetical protein DMF78_00945 [Acidobacteria bacterium]|nr:MAG: hypothetical protein DMF78_00945 [Acidobacteriota bacterium]
MSWTCLGLLLLAGTAGAPEEKKPVPLYTNEDLERVSKHRGETGVDSRPDGVPPAATAAASVHEDARKRDGRGEGYWRREAAKLHDRLRPRLARMEALRARIADREAHPGLTRSRRAGRGGTRNRATSSSRETQLATWRGQLSALEREVREEEDRFEERARRAGALPGWLR